MSDFVHLHVHTEYSLLDGAVRLDDLIQSAVAWGMPAVAMTDTNALYGAVSFYRKARAAGIRPIIGVQFTVQKDEPRQGTDARSTTHGLRPKSDARADGKSDSLRASADHAVLLAENLLGYQHLVKLVTLAQTRSRGPYVTLQELSDAKMGLFALIGGGESAILRQFADNRPQEAEAWLALWMRAWPRDRLFVDLQDHALPNERRGLPALVKWARHNDVALVATNDVHYLRREDAHVQRILASIEGSDGKVLEGDRYELASPEEMERRFSKIPDALDNAVGLAARCQLELPIGRTLLPKYPTQHGESADEVLRRAAIAGVKQRYGELTDSVNDRLQYELSIIDKMGFADYFLVVADFIRFAHKDGISTGPGRGSAAGSLVAYALRITDVDPLKNNLTFERFLNPERVSWPDIDTDFEYERRVEVIQYVVNRYGRNHVAQIGTFGTLAAKASIRDAGRALGTDARLVDKLAKLIPSFPGVTLAAALKESPGLQTLLEADSAARSLWEAAQAIEGLPRHTSVHAAGVVISPIPLDSLVPVHPGAEDTPVTQYAMDDIEALGLIKMDFLGLRTLSLIDATVQAVEKGTGRRLDFKEIPDNDAKTYSMLGRGDSDGCFQLESTGMRRVLRDFRPTRMEDLIALISLFRPGPMENIPAFVAAKHGKTAPNYLHPDLEPILSDTYGVIVYQEQIMQIAAVMAGFTLGQADLLRRAVGKKKRDVLDAERSRFVEGCLHRGYDEQVAHDVYDLIVRFADYGFNRAHAAAYAVLAYRTAYLRANHFPEFLCALLSMHTGSSEKALEYERDAKRRGVVVLPPSVNLSDMDYSVDAEGHVRRGLLSIRNVGRAAVEAILLPREDGPFRSLVDFLSRINQRAVNRKTVESLLAAGALDSFLPTDAKNPEVRLQVLEEAYSSVQAGPPQSGLFALEADEGRETLYIRIEQSVTTQSTLAAIKRIVQAYPGRTAVALFDAARRKTRLLDETFAVDVTPELIGSLEEVIGIGNARLGKLVASFGGRTSR